MSSRVKNQTRAALGQLLALALVLTLAGCANKNYVVLLPDADGSLGKVLVGSDKGNTLLDKKNQAAVLGGPVGETFQVDDEQLKKDFGAAMAASPLPPTSYLLYFELGGAVLTEASQAAITTIKEDIKRRPGSDISIIGHTDTLGDAKTNAQLGLTRAESVGGLLGNAEINTERVSIESHGENNLLVPTPDETDEPRNRRVEVVVR